MIPTLEVARQQGEEVFALEERAALAVSRDLMADADLAMQDVSRAWVATFGNLEAEAVGGEGLLLLIAEAEAAVEAALADGSVEQQELRSVLQEAGLLGQMQAREILGEGEVVAALTELGVIDSVPGVMDARLNDARNLLVPALVLMLGFVAIQTAVAQVRRAGHDLAAMTRWGVNRAAADGVTRVASSVAAGRIWVPERDACLHCTAYAGEKVGPQGEFPVGLTYADRPLTWAQELPNPPLHPNCRCRVLPWIEEWEGQVDLPGALEREAQRTVLKGWALGSEASKVRAADRLLARGADMPQRVIDQARRAVRRGGF